MEWRGIVVTVLAVGLSLTLVVATVGFVLEGRPFSDKGAEVMIAICVATVAAISAYLASTRNGK
jgi:hypothetical protein